MGLTASKAGDLNWIQQYNDDLLMDDTPLSEKYVAGIYWAFTTLTTVGYGDIIPSTDSERIFVTFSMMIGALLFAYIVGDIGSLLNTLDRQSALVEEKMDAVKEYLAWRDLPRDLSIRTRRYYEHYYTRRAVFDEEAILGSLNPQLHYEVVQSILSNTLGAHTQAARTASPLLTLMLTHTHTLPHILQASCPSTTSSRPNSASSSSHSSSHYPSPPTRSSTKRAQSRPTSSF